MIKKIVVASANVHKIKEINQILSGVEVVSCKTLGFTEDVEETGETFEDNALLKVNAVSQYLKEKFSTADFAVLADDSGLMVDALNGAPGVYSARYSGEDSNDKRNIKKLLDNLKGKEDRKAKFVTVLAFSYKGETFTVKGETTGKILDEEVGGNGFGYDPVFYSDELQKSFGVATEEEKNSVSHRSNALKNLRNKLREKGLV